MMESPKTALLGLHEPTLLTAFGRAVRRLGYEVTSTSSGTEMMPAAEQRPYDLYLLDANVGTPGAPTTAPLEAMLALTTVHESLQRGARLYAVSGNPEIVDMAAGYLAAHASGFSVRAVVNLDVLSVLKTDVLGNTTSE